MLFSSLTLLSTVLFFMSIFKKPLTFNDCTVEGISYPKYSKLIYIVIDGLRFDAVIPVKKSGLYFNNFDFFKDKDRLSTTYMSISGIPTATTARVISLMTGAPSSQMEEIMTFLQQGISIDCFCNKFDKDKVCAYGDDLWENSFKIFEDNNRCFPGFSKKELVKIEQKMVEDIKKDTHKDIKFVHFLSIDSFGHSYGTNSIHIKESQMRIDKFLSETYNSMDSDTLMVVLSDHGVTDLGAHGGNSKEELSSFCGFYSKNPFVTENYKKKFDEIFHYNYQLLSKNFDMTSVNTENDYIKAQNKYKVIHQDDILPTVCYLMGKPVPTNTYGSLVPYIVDDSEAQVKLARQKSRFLKTEVDEKLSPEGKNYFLSNKIYSDAVSTRPVYAILSALIGVFLVYKFIISFKSILYSFPYLFVTAMVSHSYYSFASEDVMWIVSFLISNPSLSNFLFCLYFLKTPGRSFFTADRNNLGISTFSSRKELFVIILLFLLSSLVRFRKVQKIGIADKELKYPKDNKKEIYCNTNNYHVMDIELQSITDDKDFMIKDNKKCNESNLLFTKIKIYNIFTFKALNSFLSYTILTLMSFKRIIKGPTENVIKAFNFIFEMDFSVVENTVNSLPQLLYIGLDSYFALSNNDKLFFILLFPSIDTLMTIHYNIEVSLLFLLMLKVLKVRDNPNSKLILLSLVPYLNGFEKVLQSVNYNVFYSYSTEFGSLSNLTGVLAHFVFPRIYITRKFSSFKEESFLHLYSLIFCFICTWVMNGSLVFSYFFVGRFFSVALFFIIDLIIDRMYRKLKNTFLFQKTRHIKKILHCI